MEAGTILFAQPLCEDADYNEKNDIAEAWCLNGSVLGLALRPLIIEVYFFSYDFLAKSDIDDLDDDSHDTFLGPADEMTLGAPINDPNNPGHLIGGTAFEWCGALHCILVCVSPSVPLPYPKGCGPNEYCQPVIARDPDCGRPIWCVI